jgi:hypothetical protein
MNAARLKSNTLSGGAPRPGPPNERGPRWFGRALSATFSRAVSPGSRFEVLESVADRPTAEDRQLARAHRSQAGWTFSHARIVRSARSPSRQHPKNRGPAST